MRLRLDHLVFAVQDLAAATDAWEATFGLRAEPPLRPEGSHLEIAVLPVGNAFIEIVRPTSPDHRVARHIERTGEGMFSISMEVDDLEATVDELRAKGVDVSAVALGVLPNSRVARIPRVSAHGVAVQLIERSAP